LASRVVNIARTKDYDQYIGRGTKWGNPFRIGIDGTRDEVIAKHAKWILTQDHLIADLWELYGKTLGCHCAPLSCHGHTLARLAVQYHVPTFFE
jgi:hypothetical protein